MPKREWKREQVLLRMLLMAPTGGGKTLGALAVASTIFDGGLPIIGIDTEHERMKLYADQVALADYRVLEGNYSPETYIRELTEVEAEYPGAILIVDSVTPEWSGSGGILEIVDKGAGGNWKEGSPKHARFVERIASLNMHVIVCCRAKMKWDYSVGEDGKRKQVLLGMGPEQRDSFLYEFDIVGDIDKDSHLATFSNRCRPLVGRTMNLVPDLDNISGPNEVSEIITEWLSEGEPPAEPETATTEAVDGLIALLLTEGIAAGKITENFEKVKRASRGVLPPEYVAEQTEKAEKRIAAKAAAGEPKQETLA